MNVFEYANKLGMDEKRAKMADYAAQRMSPSMRQRAIVKWAHGEDIVLRRVTRQHPGDWGPWYHISIQTLNPVTGKWIFVEEGGRCGHRGYPDEEAPIEIF